MMSRRGTRIRREDTAALTGRQEEVLRLLARGCTNGQIAEELGISLDGAKFHVGEIMGKLQVSTREEAVEAWRARRRNAVRGLAFLGLRWGAGALAGGALVAGAAVWFAQISGEDGQDGGTPDGTRPRTVEPSPGVSPSPVAFMVSCPEPASPVPPSSSISVILDWLDFVRFDGVSYFPGSYFTVITPPAGVAPGARGEPYGRVAFKLSGNVSDPSYRARDCDAAFLEPGTVFYTVKGYDPRFRIALADGTVYESYRGEGARTAGDFIDLRGKVTAIEFRDSLDDGGAVVGRIAEATEVERLVELFLASAFDDARQPTSIESDLPSFQLVFRLSDGTEFMRGYQPAIGRVWPGIWLPELFNEAAEAAMGQP